MQVSNANPSPSLYRTMVGGICLSAQPLVLNLIGLPVMAYVILRLGPEGYAQWMVAASLLSVCAVLTSLGLRPAFVRSVAADPDSAKAALAEQMALRLLLSVVAGAIGIATCLLLGYSRAIVWCATVGAGGLVLTTLWTVLGDLLQAFHRIKTIAAVNLAAGVGLTCVSLIAAWRGAGPIGMAIAYVSGPAISAVLMLIIVRREICPVTIRCEAGAFRRLVVRSRFLAAQQLLFAGSSQIEALMLPRLIGLSQFGVFTAGAMPANRLIVIPDGVTTAAFPVMAKACAHGAAGGALLVRRIAMLGVSGCTMIAVGVMLVAAPLGRLLLPDQAQLFATVVQITIWSLPLAALEIVMRYALNASGSDAVQARLAAPAAAASLLCSVALVSMFGLPGACWSMVLRPAVRGAFLLPTMLREFRHAPEPATRIGSFIASRDAAPLRKAG